MALFPAYKPNSSEGTSRQEEIDSSFTGSNNVLESSTQSNVNPSWLQNSSFVPPSVVPRKKRKKKRRKKTNDDDSSSSDSGFVIDRKSDPPPKQEKPREKPQPRESAPEKRKKKRRKKIKPGTRPTRYFTLAEPLLDDPQKESIPIEEFTKRTETFNKELAVDPKNPTMWLEYVRLQDLGAGTERGISDKKLAILEKALASNSGSKELLNEKFRISEKILPLDKLIVETKLLTSKEPRNIVGWEWLIRCHQFNLTRMTIPNVLESFGSALLSLHKTHCSDQSLIELLLQCGLFLRQAGLWETLWVLIQLYLELNLAQPGSGKFKVPVNLPNEQIKEKEDAVITSGLPLGALWLRIEHLREAFHFLPVDNDEDPQRMVFPDDVSHLLYPVTRAETPRLVCVLLALLKVPLLPVTDALVGFVGFKNIQWATDSSEDLLSTLMFNGICKTDTSHLEPAKELVVGPQCVMEKPGESEFFQLVNKTFENCINHLEPDDKIAFIVWQMRWWRFLLKTQGRDSKGLLQKAKKLLKEYRDSIPLYVEYALLENELGSYEAALKILETAIQLRNAPLKIMEFRRDKALLYITYVSLVLKKGFDDNKERATRALCSLASESPLQASLINIPNIVEVKEKFQLLSSQFLNHMDSSTPITLHDLFIAPFMASWVACHAWFLYLTSSVWDSVSYLHLNISKIGDAPSNTLGKILLEHYHEVLVDLMAHFSKRNPGSNHILQQHVSKAVKAFPDNIFFNLVLEDCSATQWTWKSKPMESYSSPLISIFKMHQRLKTEPADSKEALRRKIYHLLLELTKKFERNPLVWRLLIQFVAAEDPKEIQKTFYRAAEKCPWVKILFYEAAKILPEEMGQIQDLLVEKELRLHITPEELEILREDSIQAV